MEGRTLFALIQVLCNKLFEREEARIDSVLKTIWTKNIALSRVNHDGFIYKGDYYRPKSLPNAASVKAILHSELDDTMEAFLVDQQRVKDERKTIEQVLTKLLRPCQDFTEIRNALPNCLADLLEQTQGIQRTSEEAWTLAQDERGMRQYLKVRPLMEFYSAARLLY